MMDIITMVTAIFTMLILTETAFMEIMGTWRDGMATPETDGTVTRETRLFTAPGL